jgi:hypothetical protein
MGNELKRKNRPNRRFLINNNIAYDSANSSSGNQFTVTPAC